MLEKVKFYLKNNKKDLFWTGAILFVVPIMWEIFLAAGFSSIVSFFGIIIMAASLLPVD